MGLHIQYRVILCISVQSALFPFKCSIALSSLCDRFLFRNPSQEQRTQTKMLCMNGFPYWESGGWGCGCTRHLEGHGRHSEADFCLLGMLTNSVYAEEKEKRKERRKKRHSHCPSLVPWFASKPRIRHCCCRKYTHTVYSESSDFIVKMSCYFCQCQNHHLLLFWHTCNQAVFT